MSKYTMTLAEYLTHNNLPTIFNSISGFADLFVGYYCDYEIGYETESLFNIKLETKAELVIPLYSSRITAYNSILSNLNNTSKTSATTHTGTVTNAGTDKNTGTDSTTHTGTVIKTGTETTGHTGTIGDSQTLNAGKQTTESTELPINALTATPNKIQETDAFTNTSTNTKTYNNTDTLAHNVTDTNNLTDAVTHGLQIAKNNTQTNNLTDTNTITGLTPDEALRIIDFYEKKIIDLKTALLDEFKLLFMQVY